MPLFIEVVTADDIPFREYRLIHLLNPFITAEELLNRRGNEPVYLLLLFLALVAVLANVPEACREMARLYRSGPAQQPKPEAAVKDQPPEHPFADLAAGTLPSSAPQSSSS